MEDSQLEFFQNRIRSVYLYNRITYLEKIRIEYSRIRIKSPYATTLSYCINIIGIGSDDDVYRKNDAWWWWDIEECASFLNIIHDNVCPIFCFKCVGICIKPFHFLPFWCCTSSRITEKSDKQIKDFPGNNLRLTLYLPL